MRCLDLDQISRCSVENSFCIEFASRLAVMLLELNAELLDLVEHDAGVATESAIVELESAC